VQCLAISSSSSDDMQNDAAWVLSNMGTATAGPDGSMEVRLQVCQAIAAAGGLPAVVACLRSAHKRDTRQAAANWVGQMAACDPCTQAAFAAAGVVPLLARLLAGHSSGGSSGGGGRDGNSNSSRASDGSSEDIDGSDSDSRPGTKQAAAIALCVLAGSIHECRQEMAASGCLPAMVQLLSSSAYDWLLECIPLLFASLASDSPAHQQALVAAGAIPALQQLQRSSRHVSIQQAAAQALQALGGVGCDITVAGPATQTSKAPHGEPPAAPAR